MAPMSLSTSRSSLFAFVFVAGSSALLACGDDTATPGGGGAGGEGTTASGSTTTGSSSPTASSSSSSSSSPTSSGSNTTTGGEGGQGGGTGGQGGGTGGDGTGGTGAGGGQPVGCGLGDLVDDDFSYDTQLVADDGHYECTVEGVDESGPTIEATLFCIQGDVAFELTLAYTPVPAILGGFPLAPGQDVTFDDLSADPDDPPQSTGYVVRSANSGKLLFAWVYGSDLGPPAADADWADPLAITSVEDLCQPDEDAYEHYALDVTLGDDPPLRIFSEEVGVLEQAPDVFEIRVSQASYNSEIDGGFNLLYRYAILAPETIIPE
jgi:hypothetical protein